MQKPEVFTLGRTSTGELEKLINDHPVAGAIIRSWLEAKLGDDVLKTKVGQVALNVQVIVHDMSDAPAELTETQPMENDLAVN